MYEIKELISMAYAYVREQILPKLSRKIYGTDFVFYDSFKKWNSIVEFWITYNTDGKIIARSLTIKINKIGRDEKINVQPSDI